MHDETAGKERIDLVFAQARENLLLQGVALGLQDNDGGADEDTEGAGRLSQDLYLMCNGIQLTKPLNLLHNFHIIHGTSHGCSIISPHTNDNVELILKELIGVGRSPMVKELPIYIKCQLECLGIDFNTDRIPLIVCGGSAALLIIFRTGVRWFNLIAKENWLCGTD